MTPTAEIQPIADADRDAFTLTAEASPASAPPRPSMTMGRAVVVLARDALPSSALVAGTCLLIVGGASTIRHGTPWPGFDAVATGIGLGERPPRRELSPASVVAAVLMVGAGSLLMTTLGRSVGARFAGRAGVAAVVAVGGYLANRVLMSRELWPSLRCAMGGRAVVAAKYGAMGVVAAVTSPSRRRRRAASP